MELGSAAGSALGSYVGQSARGSAAGRTIGQKISKLIGSGDYTVSDRPVVNSLFPGAGGAGNGYAQFSNASQSTRICHREYLQDIFTSSTAGAFGITAFQVNPGLTFSFPYLACIAQNFEEYRIRGMVFEFISTSSPYAANSAMGSVIMAMEYNAAAPAFTNKPQMENSDFAISARFDRNMVYGVECSSNAQNSYYVRSGASVLPLTSTDLGVMYVATQPSGSFPASSNVGELWVSYDIEFLRPRITPARFGFAHSTYSGGLAAVPALDTRKRLEYGTLTGVTYVQTSASVVTITFPNAEVGDTYLFTLVGKSGGGTWSAAPVLGVVSGCSLTTAFTDASSNAYGTLSLLQSSNTAMVGLITISAQSPVVTITFSAPAINSSDLDLMIVDVGNGFAAATL